MKKSFFLIILTTFSYLGYSQCTIGTNQVVLLGAKNNGIYHQLQQNIMTPHASDPSQTEILAEAWTCNSIGVPICNFRATLKYELTQIPRDAFIASAKLYLYARTNSTNAYVGHPTYGANNDVSISRVTNDWDTSGVGYGWNDQLTTTQDQVVLPASTNDAQDYVADLKNLVQFWVNNPDSNFGMQLKQIDETYYKSMIFHSGTSVASVQPRLEICYWTEASYPKVSGIVYYDTNGNGIQDNTEIVAPYVKVGLSNGSFTFTDFNGYYEIASSTFGYYDVAITPPNFYTASNLISTFNLNQFGASYQNNVGLTATSNTDSVNIHIVPFHHFARPGFAAPCFIEYENLGNTLLTPTIGVSYDSARMQYDSCSNSTIANLGNVFGGLVNTIKPGERHFFTGYLTTKTTAKIGDTIPVFAGINSGTATAVDQVLLPVNASYDPNDKEATVILTTQQVASGKYIDYTIRFENVGNDTAFNIVIRDTLSNLLQSGTLQMISSSHNCKLTVNDSKVKVEFKKINLLYTSLNSLKSIGFVKFRVKPVSTVTDGTVINNKASIYFDYNKPIVTNTAKTTISNIIITPLKITSFEVRFSNNKVQNIWSSANEINVNYFNVQYSNNGKDFETVGKVVAKNKVQNTYSFVDELSTKNALLNTYYYRITAVDNDGKISYSEIKHITRITEQVAMSIYPNPTKDNATIECYDAKQIIVRDNVGRVIKKLNNVSTHQNISTTEFAKGIYVVQIITTKGEILTRKLVIE